jgi:hypothetical protein
MFQSDATLAKLIDPVLDVMDLDKDGFITFAEFRNNEQNMQK